MRRFHYDLIDSTNSEARRLASMHPGEPLLVTADRQSAGRGRHGRVWHSPLGGAWMSFVWPMQSEPRHYASVSLVAAVAVRRAIVQLAADAADGVRIKWPNDLLVGDRKVAGILCEQCLAGGTGRGILIIGVGVNVDFDPAALTDVRHPATTLAASLGRSFDVEAVIEAVARCIVESLAVFEREGLRDAMLAELRSSLAYVGSVRSWKSPRGVVTGRVVGVDDQGRLLLEQGSTVTAFEVGEFVTA